MPTPQRLPASSPAQRATRRHAGAWRRWAAGVTAVLLYTSALAQTSAPQQAIPTIVVSGTRDPVDKSYRKMIKAMERFERDHALAPAATLRFRLLPRKQPLDLSSVTVRVAGDSFSLPVPLAPDRSFTLPRNEQALREDAAVLANRKTATLTWRAMVQTPGLRPGTRRLGDLRLECLVGMEAGLISNDPVMIAWLTGMINSPERVCSSPDGDYLFFTDRPVFGITLRDGVRSAVLPFRMLYAGGQQTASTLPYCDCQVLLERSYFAPLWDRGWPDDTVLEFDYMDEAPTQVPVPVPESASAAGAAQ